MDKIKLNRYLSNCVACIPDRMDEAKKWFDLAYKEDPNDSRVLWLKDNFYEPLRPVSYSEEAAYWEGRILARQGT